jgi:hypothetical protein
MSVAEADEIGEILDRIKGFSVTSRIRLARQILETVDEKPAIKPPPRRRPLSDLVGLLKTDSPPPTDEEVEQIIEDERMRKYGG